LGTKNTCNNPAPTIVHTLEHHLRLLVHDTLDSLDSRALTPVTLPITNPREHLSILGQGTQVQPAPSHLLGSQVCQNPLDATRVTQIYFCSALENITINLLTIP
jgi:hypothetical protein